MRCYRLYYPLLMQFHYTSIIPAQSWITEWWMNYRYLGHLTLTNDEVDNLYSMLTNYAIYIPRWGNYFNENTRTVSLQTTKWPPILQIQVIWCHFLTNINISTLELTKISLEKKSKFIPVSFISNSLSI